MVNATPSISDTTRPGVRPKAYTAGEWSIHAWGIGAIASYFMYEQFYLINNIHTTVYKVDPRVVFIILALPRLVDGVLDPILGHWSDNCRSRWGRRRPFLLVSAIIGAITASLLFWMSPQWPQVLKGVFLAFGAITLFTACGTYDMSYSALGYELSEEYADRSRIQAIKGVYWSLVCIIGGYVIWSAANLHTLGDFLFGAPPHNWLGAWESIRPKLFDAATGEPDEVLGFRVISGVISLMILASVLFPLYWSHERYTQANRTHVNLWQALKATLRCRPFVAVLIINIARSAGTLPRNLFFFIGVYGVCHGDKAEYTKVMGGHTAVLGLLFSIVVWLATKPITRWIGKRTSFIAGSAFGLLQACLVPLFAIPGHIWYWFWLNTAFLPISMILNASAAGIMPDICDIDELAHGERREGLFTAVQSFVNKMEISVMTALTGFFIAWTGFNQDLPQQSPEVLHRMRVWGFGPLIVISAIALVVSCFMPLTKKMMDQVRAELDARHAAAGKDTAH
ncbi:MAG: MFS transporter [Planctomycetota bacterium]|nr:MFS transporter [Planctomycetota bacterium]